MRSVMVCLRTPRAEQVVANAAAQLGLTDVISTATGGAEALARMARSPADILLVDTAAVRPDTLGFTKRVLERSPGAVLVFFGPEEAEVARAAIAAGARGLIRGGEREDLCASVAKALMLLLRGNQGAPSSVPQQRSEGGEEEQSTAGVAEAAVASPPAGAAGVDARSATSPAVREPGAAAAGTTGAVTSGGTNGSGPNGSGISSGISGPGTDSGGTNGRATSMNGATDVPDVTAATDPPGAAYATGSAATGANGAARANGAGDGQTASAAAVTTGRRLALTERELQVLRGMADGKSNAEIGRELFVSEDTVKTHARRLFRKLGARDRAHAVAAAFRAGLVA